MRIQSSYTKPVYVDLADGFAIASGRVPGHSVIHKFGGAPDFDTGDGEVDIWDGAKDADPNLMQYIYSTTADIDRISSSNNGDTQKIEIQGLNKNYNLIIQTITLTGHTAAALTTALIRVFRMKNVGATDLAGTVYCFVNVATTNGVPDTLTNIRSMITIGYNQTMMALFTVPDGYTGYLESLFADLNGAKKAATYSIRLYARPYGQVFQIKHEGSLSDTVPFNPPPLNSPLKFSSRTDIGLRVETITTLITDSNVAGGFEVTLVEG